jgi:hypothetical protein
MMDALPRGGDYGEDRYRGPTINTVTSGETSSLIYLQTDANRSKPRFEVSTVCVDADFPVWSPHSN